VDLILFSETGQPAELPPGLVRRQTVILLPGHSRASLARWRRNAWRAARGVPPLIDRLSGLAAEVTRALGDTTYDLGIAEHFWCAPYLPQLEAACRQTLLDLHNIESTLHQRSASVSGMLVAAGHRRFARATRALESRLAPRFSRVAVTSETDAALLKCLAPSARSFVYPNALPEISASPVPEEAVLAFSGNFEYHPNIDAVAFLAGQIWPEIRRRHPDLRLRLIGRGQEFIRALLPSDGSIELTGPVDDAAREISRARIILAPLRVGSGTRIKILEAWQNSRPVIATPLAVEGLQTCDGVNILLAESPAAFADAVDRLLANPGLRAGLAAAGRSTFEGHYTWPAAWRCLDPLYR
jgi:glycosyltransferase involved in cell wall biosynthesis